MNHPVLGQLFFHPPDNAWIGNVCHGQRNDIEISIRGNKNQLDQRCEQLAVSTVSNIDSVMNQLQTYVEQLQDECICDSEPEWYLDCFEFKALNSSSEFQAMFTLTSDVYGWWIVTVENGQPTSYLKLEQ
jgi:hypothetical protein